MAIDIICLIFAAYGLFIGYTRGIIKTVFTIISIFFGVILAAKFGPDMTDFLQNAFNYHNSLMFLAGVLLTFVLTMVVIRMLAGSIESVLESANINIINKAAGGVLMAALFVGMYSFLVLFGDRAHVISEEQKDESITYSVLAEMPGQLEFAGKKLKPVFKEFWDYSITFMDKIDEMKADKEEQDTIYDIDEN